MESTLTRLNTEVEVIDIDDDAEVPLVKISLTLDMQHFFDNPHSQQVLSKDGASLEKKAIECKLCQYVLDTQRNA